MVGLNKKDKETEKNIKEIYKILRNCYDNMGMINESIVFESIYDSINIITKTFPEYFKESD